MIRVIKKLFGIGQKQYVLTPKGEYLMRYWENKVAGVEQDTIEEYERIIQQIVNSAEKR